MSSQKIKSSDLRDSHQQKKYRDQSQSNNKSQQHVSHWFSLDIAAYVSQFVSPPIPTQTLKSICNDFTNFRMQNAKTNLSNHKQIDNKLMNSFTNILLPKFSENQKYKTLLITNPSQLELEIRNNAVICVILKGNEAKRAGAQAKIIQRLNFPNRYTSAARLFYRCFRDRKGRFVWDDRRNTREFKQYLKTQLQKTVDFEQKSNGMQCQKCLEMKEESEGCFSDESGIWNCLQCWNELKSKKKVSDEMVGIDEKQREYYRGRKGGIYYVTASDHKKYVSLDKIPKFVTENKNGNVHLKGLYKVQKQKIVNEICKKDEVSVSRNGDRIIGNDAKGRTLYVGSRGGKYYKTASGKKQYVK